MRDIVTMTKIGRTGTLIIGLDMYGSGRLARNRYASVYRCGPARRVGDPETELGWDLYPTQEWRTQAAAIRYLEKQGWEFREGGK